MSTASTSVVDLPDHIDRWTSHWNDDPRPFTWTTTVDDITTTATGARTVLAEPATNH